MWSAYCLPCLHFRPIAEYENNNRQYTAGHSRVRVKVGAVNSVVLAGWRQNKDVSPKSCTKLCGAEISM